MDDLHAESYLTVRVTTNARKSQLLQWQDGILRVALKAQPIEGEANAELCRFLAEFFGVRRSDVTIKIGLRSRGKGIKINGLSRQIMEEKLKNIGDNL